ncbi:MAG: GNAT family N-acetyltransferase [Fusicatenibacter sp.]|nr:GNAT family N-acetyltransferase [Fusicatenibacter sp.]
MAIEGIRQPEILPVDEELRLRKYDGICDFALEWYQDVEMIRLVDGVPEPYDMAQLLRMYRYLDAHGELYFIERKEKDRFEPIGDVTFWKDDMPIVIGRADLRQKKIGTRVVKALIRRGKELGYKTLKVGEIYDENEGSRKLFTGLGFRAYEKTVKGWRYELCLDTGTETEETNR